jgi:hypothetical protein
MLEEMKDYQLMNYSIELLVGSKSDTPTIYCIFIVKPKINSVLYLKDSKSFGTNLFHFPNV